MNGVALFRRFAAPALGSIAAARNAGNHAPASASPIATPPTASHTVCRSTIHITPAGRAASAKRMPISGVRCPLMKDTTRRSSPAKAQGPPAQSCQAAPAKTAPLNTRTCSASRAGSSHPSPAAPCRVGNGVRGNDALHCIQPVPCRRHGTGSAARASSKLDTFTQAISSNAITAPRITESVPASPDWYITSSVMYPSRMFLGNACGAVSENPRGLPQLSNG